ncbi:MAG: hypothetical protein QOG54_954 [Actinomycetota bacterium]|jgi:hypothetical protein|nr:hypothetical protein [Actinomycetota bacterium]
MPLHSAGDPRPATVVTVPTNPGSDPGTQTGSGVALSETNPSYARSMACA